MNNEMRDQQQEEMPDSTLFVFEGSQDDFYRIMILFEEGQLSELLGIEVLDVGAVVESQLVARQVVNLSQWLQNDFTEAIQEGWQTLAEIFGRTALSPAFRSNAVKRAKQIQLGDRTLALFLDMAPTAGEEISILLGVYPIDNQIYLPENLRFIIFSESGETLDVAETNSSSQGILRELLFVQGERFSVEIYRGDVGITEYFALDFFLTIKTVAKSFLLDIYNGNFTNGFEVKLRIEKLGNYASGEVEGKLPPAPKIPELYQAWKSNYLNLDLCLRGRIVQRIDDVGQLREQCRQLYQELRTNIKDWLRNPENNFQKIRERLIEELRDSKERQEEVIVFIKTENNLLKRLPWNEWDLFCDRYTKAEIALRPLEYEGIPSVAQSIDKKQVRILAILGNSNGINVQGDREFLESLPGANPLFLPEPQRQELSAHLWEQSWDILFFAGHSSSGVENGRIYINQTESLSVTDLKHGLRKAIERGLHLAIFNSCDGLKLAEDLADLNIPQAIVMREPVPDLVAQQFLKHFLTAFSRGESLYLAVREARERLCDEGWDNVFPGAAGLAVIYQNPAVVPQTWRGFLSQPVVRERPSWIHKDTLTGHSDTVESVAISPDGKTLASGSLDHSIRLWSLATGELLNTLTGHSSVVLSLAFSPDGKTLASASNMAFRDGTVKLWDVATGKLRQTLGDSLLALRVSSVAFSPDGNHLASGHIGFTSIDTKINLWHLGSGKVQRTLKGHGWDVRSIAFSSDGQILVSGSMDGAIMIWDWRTGERLRTLNRPTDLVGSMVAWFDSSIGAIWSVAISPDGQTIASGGSQQPIGLWNTASGKPVRILTEHSGRVYAVAFSPDGTTLASGGEDNTIRIWNFHSGEVLQTLRHLGPVMSVAFSLDGQTLVSGSADSTVKIWRLSY